MADLPPKYRYATVTWRGLTGACGVCGHSLLSFEIEDLPDGGRADLIAQLVSGEPMRLRLAPETVQNLIEVLPECQSRMGNCPVCRVQSERSSGNPTADGSMHGGGQNV